MDSCCIVIWICHWVIDYSGKNSGTIQKHKELRQIENIRSEGEYIHNIGRCNWQNNKQINSILFH